MRKCRIQGTYGIAPTFLAKQHFKAINKMTSLPLAAFES